MTTHLYLLFVFLIAPLVGGEHRDRTVEGVAVDWTLVEEGSEAALVATIDSRVGHDYRLQESQSGSAWEETGIVGLGTGDALELAPFAMVGKRRMFRIEERIGVALVSQKTGIEYPIHVVLPDGYEETDKMYPVIYVTDGQWITQSFSRMVKEKGIEAILVTIEQGPGDRRATDYRLPGSKLYYEVLRDELLPAVESLYRVDTNQRTFCGTSYGGLLVGVVMFLERPETQLFRNYWSFDGSFNTHRVATYELEAERFAASSTMNATLLLTSATRFPNNNTQVNQFEDYLTNRAYKGLSILRRSYSVDHYGIADPSFDEALDILFPVGSEWRP